MTFQETQRRVETARAELTRAQADATGWSDQKRREFDADRMKHLADATVKLTVALKRAQEAQATVERLTSDQCPPPPGLVSRLLLTGAALVLFRLLAAAGHDDPT